MLPFAVVEFEDKTVAVICTTWVVVEEEDCRLWQNLNSSKVVRLVQAGQEPCSSWNRYSVRGLGKAGRHDLFIESFL